MYNDLVVCQRGAQVEERRYGCGEDSVRDYKPRLSCWVIGILSGAITHHIAGVCSPAAPHREHAQWGHGLKHQPQTTSYCTEHNCLYPPLNISFCISQFLSLIPQPSMTEYVEAGKNICNNFINFFTFLTSASIWGFQVLC